MNDRQALMADRTEDGRFGLTMRELTAEELPEGDLLVQVEYSSLNYKDALALTDRGKVIAQYPMVPGIDLAGVVVSSRSGAYREGDRVIATGHGLGVSHYGGFSRLARIPAEWALPLPDGLSLREAMALGTAGLTAALSVRALEQRGIGPGSGPVLVTGATGGVGSMAVGILAAIGCETVAATGKADVEAMLRGIGASRVISREALAGEANRPLLKQQWAGAVDCVGGETLAGVLSAVRSGGTVAASGMAGGGALHTTVFPFILRGVTLAGIDSVWAPREERERLWNRLAGPWKPAAAMALCREIGLAQLEAAAEAMLRGESRGRTIVRLA